MSDTDNKSQRLASAIYLVTGFFNDQEPLKWKLRTLSTDLVSERVKDKFTLVREIISLFSIAQTAGLISEMNHGILLKELFKLEREVENPFGELFFPETKTLERTLREPQRLEAIKDKTVKERTESRPELKEFGAWSRPSIKKNSRQSIIIGLLKRKKEIMIKDVSALISGCSEKTIQRELLGMVASGILRKIGEKRWSKYALA